MLQNIWEKHRRDLLFAVGLIALVFAYFYNILDLKTGFYSGDHRQQHYPWAYFYWQQLRNWQLPWWTSLMGCGFPLLAEGQIGALYPFNFLFYRLFSFDFAYTYNILFHYCLGGIFFYTWLQKNNLVRGAAFGATIIYLFGTAQGGYFYNIISLKTLIWFPLSLLLAQKIICEGKLRLAICLALVFSMEWLAGYLQYAIYAVLFCGITSFFYFCNEMYQRRWKGAWLGLASVTAALILSILIALPQLAATWELSRFSNRFDFPLEFAYIGSMNPLAIATVFFPQWDGFLGSELYFGVLGLLFLIVAIFSKRNIFLTHCMLGMVLAIFFALGQWNPVFKFFVELTHFSGFRIPTKFLYFAAVYGAAICGIGMHQWVTVADQKVLDRSRRVWAGLLIVALCGWVASYVFFYFGKDSLMALGKNYLNVHYQQSSIHPFSMDVYVARLEELIDSIFSALSLRNTFNQGILFWMIFTPLMCWGMERKLKNRKLLLGVLLTLLFLNLWAFGNTSIRGSLRDKSFLSVHGPITNYLQNKPGRLHRAYKTIASSDELEIVPHNHMVANIPLLGAYSPFVMKSYYEWMRELGDVNDSNVQLVSDKEKFLAASGKLDEMSASWILSDHPFSFDRYQLMLQSEGSFLYHNPYAKPRIGFHAGNASEWALEFHDTQNRIQANFSTVSAGKVLIRDMDYPGWKVFLNDKQVEYSKYSNLYKMVDIPAQGEWSLALNYDPAWKKIVPYSLGLFILCALAAFGLSRKRYEKI